MASMHVGICVLCTFQGRQVNGMGRGRARDATLGLNIVEKVGVVANANASKTSFRFGDFEVTGERAPQFEESW